MEISKSLHEDIMSVQSQLKNAIRDHQICVLKLKDDPENTDIMERMREIQLHIVALGRWQKQVVQQLRTEVQSFKSENPVNGSRVTVASLLGLGHHNHHHSNSSTRLAEVAVVANIQQRLQQQQQQQQQRLVNGHANKEDYEDVVRNGSSSPLREDAYKKSRHPDKLPVEDYVDGKPVREQQCFLSCLGLITNDQHTKLQSKRAERKRRSTAGSNFLYTNWEVPTKRKKHNYLVGSAPQTRAQTTARLNGSSPPPFNKASSRSSSSSSSSSKSLVQKPKTVAILPKLQNGDVAPKRIKRTAEAAVHIPKLPSGLTIERIENDSTVCVTCRNPGSLMICEFCATKFHVSCHTVSPASSNYCPNCAVRFRSSVLDPDNLESLRHELSLKKEKEAAAQFPQRAFGKPEQDPQFDKSSSGLHKTDASQVRQQQLLNLGIKQLPSSTCLIPISASSSTPARETVDESVIPGPSTPHILASSALSRLGYATVDHHHHQQQQQQQQQSLLLGHLTQPSLESRLLHHSYGEVITNPGQSLLVLDPPPAERPAEKRRWGKKKSAAKSKQGVSVLNYEWSGRASTSAGSQKSELSISKLGKNKGTGGGGNYVTVEVICNNEDDTKIRKTTSENSNDCVYVSESSHSSGLPDVIDLESPTRTDEGKQSEEEIEVHNVSSGSSGDHAAESAQDHGETARNSVSPAGSSGSSRNNSSTSSNFLGSIFPGKYGFKLDIIEVGSSAGRSSSLSSSTASMPGSPKQQHVKLEETNLPTTPPAAEQPVNECCDDSDKKVDEQTDKADL